MHAGSGGLPGDAAQQRPPAFWSAAEKAAFVDVFKAYGKDWDRLAAAIPGKTRTQIKNYFQGEDDAAHMVDDGSRAAKRLRLGSGGHMEDDLRSVSAGGGLRRASGSADAALQLRWGRRGSGEAAAGRPGSGSPLSSPRGVRPGSTKRASDTDVLMALRHAEGQQVGPDALAAMLAEQQQLAALRQAQLQQQQQRQDMGAAVWSASAPQQRPGFQLDHSLAGFAFGQPGRRVDADEAAAAPPQLHHQLQAQLQQLHQHQQQQLQHQQPYQHPHQQQQPPMGLHELLAGMCRPGGGGGGGEERSKTAPPEEYQGFREGPDAAEAAAGLQQPARPAHPTFQELLEAHSVQRARSDPTAGTAMAPPLRKSPLQPRPQQQGSPAASPAGPLSTPGSPAATATSMGLDAAADAAIAANVRAEEAPNRPLLSVGGFLRPAPPSAAPEAAAGGPAASAVPPEVPPATAANASPVPAPLAGTQMPFQPPQQPSAEAAAPADGQQAMEVDHGRPAAAVAPVAALASAPAATTQAHLPSGPASALPATTAAAAADPEAALQQVLPPAEPEPAAALEAPPPAQPAAEAAADAAAAAPQQQALSPPLGVGGFLAAVVAPPSPAATLEPAAAPPGAELAATAAPAAAPAAQPPGQPPAAAEAGSTHSAVAPSAAPTLTRLGSGVPPQPASAAAGASEPGDGIPPAPSHPSDPAAAAPPAAPDAPAPAAPGPPPQPPAELADEADADGARARPAPPGAPFHGAGEAGSSRAATVAQGGDALEAAGQHAGQPAPTAAMAVVAPAAEVVMDDAV